MSRFLLVFLVALFAGDAVASEANWGNLRAMLTRPGRRAAGCSSAKVESATLLALIVTVAHGRRQRSSPAGSPSAGAG